MNIELQQKTLSCFLFQFYSLSLSLSLSVSLFLCYLYKDIFKILVNVQM